MATPTPHPIPPAATPTDEIVRGGLESLVYMARNLAGRPRAAAERDPKLAAFLGSPGMAWLPAAIRDRFVVAFGVMSEEAQLLDATGVDTTGVLDLLLDLLTAAAYVAVDCYAPARARADVRIVRDGSRAVGYFQVTRPRGDWATSYWLSRKAGPIMRPLN